MADANDLTIRKMEMAWEMVKVKLAQNAGGDAETRQRNIIDSFSALYESLSQTVSQSPSS